MNKIEKIEEIIREYENGCDSSIDALDILEGIKNVIDDPTFTNEIYTETPAGKLCACINSDPHCPSVSMYLMPKSSDTILDLAYAEVKGEELMEAFNESEDVKLAPEDVCLYTYADPFVEEYTQRSIIKREDVIKALEIETVDYEEISSSISKLLSGKTDIIKASNHTVKSLYNGNCYVIELKKCSMFATTGGDGYILSCAGDVNEEIEFAVAKALQDATKKPCYPRSGDEPWSWKGILTEEHITELEKDIKEPEQMKPEQKIDIGILHAEYKTGSYPGIMICCDLPNEESTPIALIEYNKDSGKIEVSTYDENSEDPRTTYEMKTYLKEEAIACRRKAAECEAVLNEAYREEYPEEVITIREEAELKSTMETCNKFYEDFVKFTGDEV